MKHLEVATCDFCDTETLWYELSKRDNAICDQCRDTFNFCLACEEEPVRYSYDREQEYSLCEDCHEFAH